jgi:hypothetical protein
LGQTDALNPQKKPINTIYRISWEDAKKEVEKRKREAKDDIDRILAVVEGLMDASVIIQENVLPDQNPKDDK